MWWFLLGLAIGYLIGVCCEADSQNGEIEFYKHIIARMIQERRK